MSKYLIKPQNILLFVFVRRSISFTSIPLIFHTFILECLVMLLINILPYL